MPRGVGVVLVRGRLDRGELEGRGSRPGLGLYEDRRSARLDLDGLPGVEALPRLLLGVANLHGAADDADAALPCGVQRDAELRAHVHHRSRRQADGEPVRTWLSALAVNEPANKRAAASDSISKTPGPCRATKAPRAKAIWTSPAAKSSFWPGVNWLPAAIGVAASVQRQFVVATNCAAGRLGIPSMVRIAKIAGKPKSIPTNPASIQRNIRIPGRPSPQ